MDILLKVVIVLVVGFIGGKLASLVKLPNVSGYIVSGLLLGPSLFNLITPTEANALTFISEIALSVIAFSIGSEFVLKEILKVGKSIAVITLAEVLGAFLLVFCVMQFIFQQDFAFSIVIASMSVATAPAATLLVMKQYKAYGPLTKTILPVVALDDVYGIMLFGICMAIAKITLNATDMSLFQMISAPLIEIGGSLLLGLSIGLVLSFVAKKLKSRDDLQIVSLVAMGLGLTLSKVIGCSSLLTNIVIGSVLANLVRKSERVFSSVNDFILPFYVLFFTLAGATLDLHILASIGMIGFLYILARGGGKLIGAWLGAAAMKTEKSVRNYLGLALLPQGGISIGLCVLVNQQLPQYSVAITTIIMFSVLVFETTGPIFAKIAISKAGEINGLDRISEQETAPQDTTSSSQPSAIESNN